MMLRLLTVMELYLHPEEYSSNHPIFKSVVEEGKSFKTSKTAFQSSLEDKYVQSCGKNEIKCIKNYALSICEPNTYVSFMAVLGLVNVINIPIEMKTFRFKSQFESWFKHLTNRSIIPRVKSDAEVLKLFWTSQNPKIEKLDHFAPIFPVISAPDVEVKNKVKQFTGEDIFDYKSMSSIFVEIGSKRKAGIFADCRVVKKRDQKSETKIGKKIPITPLISPYKSFSTSKSKVTSASNSNAVASKGKSLLNFFSHAPVIKHTPASNATDNVLSLQLEASLPAIIVSPSSSASSVHKEPVLSANMHPKSPVANSSILQSTNRIYIHNYVEKNLSAYDRIEAIKNCWEPTNEYKFPLNKTKKKFQHQWLSSYKWLAYSENAKGAFCKMCVLFGSAVGDLQLFNRPFCNYNNAHANFKRHDSTKLSMQ